MSSPDLSTPQPTAVDSNPLHTRDGNEVALQPLLASRWSPRTFDPDRAIADTELRQLLEAMRWSPSLGNTQPWRVVLARRGEASYPEVLACLTEKNQTWAASAPLLMIGGYDDGSTAVDRDGNPRKPLSHAAYDLGQSMAHLSVQATSMGLFVHQMAGIVREQIAARLSFPAHVQPFVGVAVGALGGESGSDPELTAKKLRERQRREVAEFAFGGAYGNPLPF